MNAHTQIRPAARYNATTATTTFEVEVLLGGTFLKGYADTHDDPGQPDSFEDIEVEQFGGLKLRLDGMNSRPFQPKHRWETIDLFDGVDRNNPEIQKFLANVLALIGEDADAALLSEVSE